jgi:hypothetical protein
MKQAPYTARQSGSDNRPYVDGPGNGCGYNSGTLWPEMRLPSFEAALAAALIANEAYQQGADAARREIRATLGLNQ